MRWLTLVLVLVLVLPLLACESRVIVSRSPSPQTVSPSATPAVSPSATASPTPAKVALQPVPSVSPATRLLSYERGGDIGRTSLRFVLTDDGRVITEDPSGDLVQRKLSPSGAAAMVLQAIETRLFDRDADYRREPLPGTTPPARGTTVLILVVANGPREVRVSVEPTGQPDDERYQPSPTREKLTALARGYEDLSWVPASNWVESRPQPYQPAFHRLFLLSQPNVAPAGRPSDADAIWPFLTPIDGTGEPMGGTSWRCVVLVDGDALTLGEALARAGELTRYGWGSAMTTAALAWRGNGSVRLQINPLLPHEPATCAGAPPPL
ncbi:MAG: hypothetical protein ACRDF9_11230 [Candidatus Limnocylindria bacterium]